RKACSDKRVANELYCFKAIHEQRQERLERPVCRAFLLLFERQKVNKEFNDRKNISRATEDLGVRKFYSPDFCR
ncbi:MAG: hypothetical protein J6B18_06640, partial [Bacteroidaceae bacterium]|nr:hypothetical protein [Bacteroidaceae bacterium]